MCMNMSTLWRIQWAGGRPRTENMELIPATAQTDEIVVALESVQLVSVVQQEFVDLHRSGISNTIIMIVDS